ncbi:hypothetical protein [Microlunatus flavus]|uniref:Uncharacterized protein n=1 Tax=Microlunatus flavus TaxID=1036181 RepID=A0A1H9IIT7_9ACTN|nr:hypothetical protein [Microlunatus flavus]SEQ74504.1 hypothetical protein SAMN05421756_105269 [Microlunatus flavus]
MVGEVAWDDVWRATAKQLDQYRGAGLENLLTEDVVRFATIQQLVAAGVAPTRLEAEWRRPGVPDAVDLVVSGPDFAAVEFKYPREPRETNAAWTQHLGEALKDFYRLAHMPKQFTSLWCVQLLSERMRRYLDGVADRHGVRFGLAPGEETVLDPARVQALPATAHRGLARWQASLPTVEARCSAAHQIGKDLLLVVHSVTPHP